MATKLSDLSGYILARAQALPRPVTGAVPVIVHVTKSGRCEVSATSDVRDALRNGWSRTNLALTPTGVITPLP